MEQVENLVQTETGPRHVVQGTYQGTKFEVVAGYDIHKDHWMFHVYLHHNQGSTERLTSLPTRHQANSLQDAFDRGMKLAMKHLSQDQGSQPRQGQ